MTNDDLFKIDLYDTRDVRSFDSNVATIDGIHRKSVLYLEHGTTYRIGLFNCSPFLDADVLCKVDGNSIGTYRVPAKKSVIVQRPLTDDKKFIFVDTSQLLAKEKEDLFKNVSTELLGTLQFDVRFAKQVPYTDHHAKHSTLSRKRGFCGFMDLSKIQCDGPRFGWGGGGGGGGDVERGEDMPDGVDDDDDMPDGVASPRGGTVFGGETGQRFRGVRPLDADDSYLVQTITLKPKQDVIDIVVHKS